VNNATIEYSITPEEWVRTAGMRTNENCFPLYYAFFGLVSFRIGDREVLGDGQFDMSVADLAVGLADISEKLPETAFGSLKFQQSDDMLEIEFEMDGQTVSVSHNLAPGQSWTCTRSVLDKAIGDFVRAFTREAVAKIPAVLDWKDLSRLRAFSVEPTE
jgi:hypothetical protein